ncbi:MAG: hypothetical protein WA908_11345 [Pontixanthobacter sp.]
MDDKLWLLAAVLTGLILFMAVPGIIALIRRHPERRLIYKLCPLTFLSFLLWFALIAWAWTGNMTDSIINRYVARLRENNRLPIIIAGLVVLGIAGSLIAMQVTG